MKVGLISDIHAHYSDLVKALRIFKRVGVDKILCAGDLVEKGHDGDAVVDLMQKLKIPCVLGNHDEMAPGNQQWVINNMDMSHPNTQSLLLKDESIQYLESLPRQLRFNWEGLDLLLVHGSPTSNMEYLSLKTSINRYRKHAQIANADIIVFGHSHIPIHYVVDNVHFINPGATKPIDFISSHTCIVLTLPKIEVQLFHLSEGSHTVLLPASPLI
jgi:putative phosphoesterase